MSGVAVRIEAAGLTISGHRILRDISVSVAEGEHLAIVGESGAGKSSLVGLLLGWYAAVEGSIEIDDQPIDHSQLRDVTVWIDPTVQLWNRSLLFNLLYGSDETPSLADVMQTANLAPVIKRHRDLQEPIGESGRKLSGGEGQRVRIGRGFARAAPRLVILDEPFRGLNRAIRETLLRDIRDRWRNATILFVTHEIEQTLDFDRVIVMAGGVLTEIVDPRVALEDTDSHYRKLLDARRVVDSHYAKIFPETYRVSAGTIVRGET